MRSKQNKLPRRISTKYVGTRNDRVITVWRERSGKREMWALIADSPNSQADLAMAIMTEAAGPDVAHKHYREFASEVISKLDRDAWVLSRVSVLSWCQSRNVSNQAGGNP
jgi:hypothetical protein